MHSALLIMHVLWRLAQFAGYPIPPSNLIIVYPTIERLTDVLAVASTLIAYS